MAGLQLISDSTCDLSKTLLEQYNIDTIPLYVTFGDAYYRDGVDMTPDDLYRKVVEVGDVPKTAAAGPADFESVFKKHLDEGKQVLYLGIGSKFSASLQNAMVAKQNLGSDDIFLVDSENLSSGSGLLLLKAAKWRDEGYGPKDIRSWLRELIPKVRTQFVIDTLEYLHKGGRIKAISRFVGTRLKLKPIIKVVDGEMTVGKKPRGNMRIAIKRMLEDVFKDVEAIDPEFVMITHSHADDSVKYIKQELSAKLDVQHLLETHAGCVISTHCGPGTVGVLYIEK